MKAERLALDVLEHPVAQVGLDAIRELEAVVPAHADAEAEEGSDTDDEAEERNQQVRPFRLNRAIDHDPGEVRDGNNRRHPQHGTCNRERRDPRIRQHRPADETQTVAHLWAAQARGGVVPGHSAQARHRATPAKRRSIEAPDISITLHRTYAR